MNVILYRIEDYSQKPGAPGWIRRVEYRSGKPVKPILRCNCGRLVGLGLHRIDADGFVTASFLHKRGHDYAAGEDPAGCGWHVNVTLSGYSDGVFEANP